ncbi:MAG: hypothetical protein MUE99_05400, partial [Chitinophagaceae bacterium]|nr:hypothetical protein [Chitinophagaceae bacterium]
DRHLQVCKQVGKYLISHAGLTQTWCLNHHIPFTNPQKKVNDLLFVNPRAFAFSPGPFNEKTGDEPQQGPLWVRPGSLEADAIPGFIQVVGHTQQPGIIFDQHIIYIDVFSFTPKYLQITPDGNALVRGL